MFILHVSTAPSLSIPSFCLQRWPLLIALLPGEDPGDWGIVRGSGVRWFPGRSRPWRDRHGAIHPAERLRPGHGEPRRRAHGGARHQVHPQICPNQGERINSRLYRAIERPQTDANGLTLFWPVCICVCQIEELEAGTPGKLKVTAKSTESDEIIEGEYNTVSTDQSFLPKNSSL